MAYMALYRAYRPQKFSEVVGQAHIVKTLQNAIKLNKVAHAYLFNGPRGTGKTTLAKILAKALNCENGPTIEPCCSCSNCIGITKGMISDVIEIDAASNNGADDIREIRDGVKFLPSSGKFKVYIIDEVHMLSNAAFNALLKTLEEPPKHVIFILATTEPHKLPATILSRCQRYDFQAISENDIMFRLKKVVLEEKINASDEALSLISECAEGGMRDALSLLDAAISYSTDGIVDVKSVLAVGGNIDSEMLLKLLSSILNKDCSNALKIFNDIINEGKEISRLVTDLIMFLRDTMLYKNNALESLKSIYTKDEYILFAKEISSDKVFKFIDILNDLQNNIRFTNQKRAYVEVSILKMIDYEGIIRENVVVKPQIQAKQEVEKVHKEKVNKVKEINITPSLVEVSEEDYVSISDIEEILNNASKSKKEFMINVFETLNKNVLDPMLNMLTGGKIVASTADKILVVLKDEGICNRVMRIETFKHIMSKINENQNLINDYIAIPYNIWDSIFNDYKSKYKDNPQPKLNDIKIMVKKHVEKTKKNDIVLKAYELFGNDKVQVIEED